MGRWERGRGRKGAEGRRFVSTDWFGNPIQTLMNSWTRSFLRYFDSNLAMRKSFASEYFSGLENPGTSR